MAHAEKSGPKYHKEDIGSICYHAKPAVNDALYQKGAAPSKVKTGAQMDQESGKNTPHNEREEGKPTNYMGKQGQYGHGYELHHMPTNFETRAANDDFHAHNVVRLNNWKKHYQNIDTTEIPQRSPIGHDRYIDAGEGNPPNKFSEERAYAMPQVTLGKKKKLAHGNEKDTSIPIYVQDIVHDPDMEMNKMGYAISKAANDSIEPSQAHHARAKALKFSLPSKNAGKTLEEKIEDDHSSQGVGHQLGEAAAGGTDVLLFAAKHFRL